MSATLLQGGHGSAVALKPGAKHHLMPGLHWLDARHRLQGHSYRARRSKKTRTFRKPHFGHLSRLGKLGWHVRAHCLWSPHNKTENGSARCDTKIELDIITLLWTRGALFPLDQIACPAKCLDHEYGT